MKNKLRLITLSVLFAIGTIHFSIAQSFKLKCNSESIQVNEQNDVPLSYKLNTYKFARVTYKGKPLQIEITASDFEFSNSDWDISPQSYGIEGTKDD